MIIKTDMKNINEKANNLREGAIYINTNTGTPCRLVNILPCEGVWLETFDGEGYGDTVKFEDVSYASEDEVQDFLEDHRVWKGHSLAPSHKETCSFSANTLGDVIVERGFVQADDVHYDKTSFYTDSFGNDCRDHDQNAWNFEIDETDCWK
jgi:hypothetical protein